MLIDVHTHIGRLSPDPQECTDATSLIAKMDAWGVRISCVLPVSDFPDGGYRACNTQDVIAACARYLGKRKIQDRK